MPVAVLSTLNLTVALFCLHFMDAETQGTEKLWNFLRLCSCKVVELGFESRHFGCRVDAINPSAALASNLE